VKNVAHENFKNQFFTTTRDEYETWNVSGNNLSRDLIEKLESMLGETNTNFYDTKTLLQGTNECFNAIKQSEKG
jgi:hypothetical protein